jgi:hypothetical protein
VEYKKSYNFTLLNSGSERKKKKHQFGCKFNAKGEFLKYLKEFKIINERMFYLKLKAKWFACTLINVQAPKEKKEEVNK